MSGSGTQEAPAKILALIVTPRKTFRALRQNPSLTQIGIIYCLFIVLFPIAAAVVSYPELKVQLAAEAGAERAAPLVAAAIGISALALQLAMSVLNLLTFAILSRVAGADRKGKFVFAAWLYALVPLIFRHFVLSSVTFYMGPDWYLERAGYIAVLDPFVLWSALLLFWAARETLGVRRVWAAILVASISSILGSLAVIAQMFG